MTLVADSSSSEPISTGNGGGGIPLPPITLGFVLAVAIGWKFFKSYGPASS